MRKLLPALSLLLAPAAIFSQAILVINGATPVTIVESGGVKATPIYLEIANPANTAIKVNGSNGWIVSEGEFNMVKWDISNATGTYVVPFGSAGSYNALNAAPLPGIGNYIPLTVSNIAGGSVGGSIKFSTYHTLPLNSNLMPSDVTNMGPIYPSISSPSPIDDSYYVVDRFWIMDSYLNGPNLYTTKPGFSNITFSYLSSGSAYSEVGGVNKAGIEPLLLVQRWNPQTLPKVGWGDWLGSQGLDVPGGMVGTDQTGIGVTSANNFRSWTLSSQNSPLPVDVNIFTAQCNSGTALIQWTSKSELNNASYTVTKSPDNIHFETVATIPGAGTTSMPNSYSVTDNSPYSGVSYYYLYQTDVNGNKAFVLNTTFNGCGTPAVTSVNAYNTTNYIQVDINSVAADNFDISLINMLGQTVMTQNHSVVQGGNQIQLNNLLSPGVYILNVKNAKLNYTKKLIIGVR